MTVCARYLEYIIAERHEEIPDFHDRLAVIYLDMTLAAKRKSDESEFCFVQRGVFLTYSTIEARNENYQKLLAFIDSNQYYSVSKLFSLVSSTGAPALYHIAPY
jgi:Vam6/Vps39-like protein vacuolar protein sorting-associated protein 39